jgi:hypothetical protein
MREWPLGIVRRWTVSNRLLLRWLKTVVVSEWGKGAVRASGGVREGERERTIVEAPKSVVEIRTGVSICLRDEPGGCVRFLARWSPACRWREPGLRGLWGTGEGAWPGGGVPADRPVVVVKLL